MCHENFAIFLLSKETFTIRTCSILEGFFRKLLSKATFERKLSSVPLALASCSLMFFLHLFSMCASSQNRPKHPTTSSLNYICLIPFNSITVHLIQCVSPEHVQTARSTLHSVITYYMYIFVKFQHSERSF